MSRAPSPIGARPSAGSAGQDLAPHALGLVRREVQLVPHLAGVAGAADAHVREAADLAEAELVVAELGQLEPLHGALQDRRRAGTLHGDHRRRCRLVVDPHVEARGVLAQPGEVALAVRGVDHQVDAVPLAVDEQVVDRIAVRLAEQAVADRAQRDPGDEAGDQALDEGHGVPSREVHATHVGQVEQAGALAHRPRLLQDRPVLDRHVPTSELDEGRTGALVQVVERGLLHGPRGAGFGARGRVAGHRRPPPGSDDARSGWASRRLPGGVERAVELLPGGRGAVGGTARGRDSMTERVPGR